MRYRYARSCVQTTKNTESTASGWRESATQLGIQNSPRLWNLIIFIISSSPSPLNGQHKQFTKKQNKKIKWTQLDVSRTKECILFEGSALERAMRMHKSIRWNFLRAKFSEVEKIKLKRSLSHNHINIQSAIANTSKCTTIKIWKRRVSNWSRIVTEPLIWT